MAGFEGNASTTPLLPRARSTGGGDLPVYQVPELAGPERGRALPARQVTKLRPSGPMVHVSVVSFILERWLSSLSYTRTTIFADAELSSIAWCASTIWSMVKVLIGKLTALSANFWARSSSGVFKNPVALEKVVRQTDDGMTPLG
jgi:hypothetical protein